MRFYYRLKGGKKGHGGKGGKKGKGGKGGKKGKGGKGGKKGKGGKGGKKGKGDKKGKKGLSEGKGGKGEGASNGNGKGGSEEDEDYEYEVSKGKGSSSGNGKGGSEDDEEEAEYEVSNGKGTSNSGQSTSNSTESGSQPVKVPVSVDGETIVCDGVKPEDEGVVGVDYKYKIVLDEDADFSATVAEIESKLLASVGESLLACKKSRKLARRLSANVLGVSSFPEHSKSGSCGDLCSEMDGGMTVYVEDDGSADFTETQCEAIDSVRNKMTQLPSEIDGLSSAEFIGDSEIDCDGYGSTVDDKGGLVIAGATDGTSVAPSDGMGVGSKIGIAVAALALLLLLLLFVRRGKNDNDGDLTPYTADKDLDSVETPHTVDAVSPSFMAAALGGAAFYNGHGEQLITQLYTTDVLLDKRSSPTEHEGNTTFRGLVYASKAAYQAADNDKKKANIARNISKKVKSSKGRFLTKVDPAEATRYGVPVGLDSWYVADDETSMQFIHRAFNGDDMDAISALNAYDVLLDKSSSPTEAEGNTRLRALVNSHKTDFENASSDEKKELLARSIMNDVHINGGRFLIKMKSSDAKRSGATTGLDLWRNADDASAVGFIMRKLSGADDNEIVTQLCAHDVLIDKSSSPTEHEGNTRLRALTHVRKADYLLAVDDSEKNKIALSIIDQVHANGGRFLKKMNTSTAKRAGVSVSKGADAWRMADDQSTLDLVLRILGGNEDAFLTQLNPHDALLAKSAGPFEHEGNSRLRALVRARKAGFANARSDSAKIKIVHAIKDAVESKGGRFLNKAEIGKSSSVDQWKVADEDAALTFITQHLDGSFDEVITQVGVHDVLLDRPNSSVIAAKHEGNGRFRALVASRMTNYIAAHNPSKKESIARDVMDEVHVNGGRFLSKMSATEALSRGVAKNVDAWTESNDDVALAYVKQALAGENDDGRAAMAGLFGIGLGADALKAHSAAGLDGNGRGCFSSMLGCGRKNKGSNPHVAGVSRPPTDDDDEVAMELDFQTSVDVHRCTSATCTTCQRTKRMKVVKVDKDTKSREMLNTISERHQYGDKGERQGDEEEVCV